MPKLTWLMVASAVLAPSLIGSHAQAQTYRPPRNAAGQPDFQGIWTNSSLTGLSRPPMIKGLVPTAAEAAAFDAMFKGFLGPLLSTDPIDPEKPAPPKAASVANSDFIEMRMELGTIGGQVRSSWIVAPANGQIPLTEAGKALTKTMGVGNRYEDPEARPATERCLTAVGSPEGPPMLNTGFNAHYQFVQTKDHVAIHIEMNHDVRIIRLADRNHAPAAVQRYMGDSVGWWEGDTLVVETTNFHSLGAYVSDLFGAFAYRPESIVRERFTRTAKDEMLYEFTVEDPVIFSSPWRAEMSFRPAPGPIYEYACHEGNYGVALALSGARYQEWERAEAAKQAAGSPASGR